MQLALPLAEPRAESREAGPRPRRGLDPVGENLDLREVMAAIVDQYFSGRFGADPGQLDVGITWGRRPARRRRRRARSRSIRLGSYRYDTRVVRIHRALDHPEVPRFVVESVVHHELVHAALPEPAVGWDGRRRIHTPEFRHLEREFVHHRQAQEWIAQNFRRLLELR